MHVVEKFADSADVEYALQIPAATHHAKLISGLMDGKHTAVGKVFNQLKFDFSVNSVCLTINLLQF